MLKFIDESNLKNKMFHSSQAEFTEFVLAQEDKSSLLIAFLEELIPAGAAKTPIYKRQDILAKLNTILKNGAKLNEYQNVIGGRMREMFLIHMLSDAKLAYAIAGLLLKNGYNVTRCPPDLALGAFPQYARNGRRIFLERRKVALPDNKIYLMSGLNAILCFAYNAVPNDRIIPYPEPSKDHPNDRDCYGKNTYLHKAVFEQQSKTEIQKLIDKGFDVSAANADGMTPLDIAKYFAPDNKEVLDLLSQKQLQKNQQSTPILSYKRKRDWEILRDRDIFGEKPSATQLCTLLGEEPQQFNEAYALGKRQKVQPSLLTSFKNYLNPKAYDAGFYAGFDEAELVFDEPPTMKF